MVVFSSHHTAAVAATPVPRAPTVQNTSRAAVVAQRVLLPTHEMRAFVEECAELRRQGLKSACIGAISKADVNYLNQLLASQNDPKLLCEEIASNLRNDSPPGTLYKCMICIGDRISYNLRSSIFFESVQKGNTDVIGLFLRFSGEAFLKREVGPALNRAAFSGSERVVHQLLEKAGDHTLDTWVAWAYRSSVLRTGGQVSKTSRMLLRRFADSSQASIKSHDYSKETPKYREEMRLLLENCSKEELNRVCAHALKNDQDFLEKIGPLFRGASLRNQLNPKNVEALDKI